jgi:hypothetical protein
VEVEVEVVRRRVKVRGKEGRVELGGSRLVRAEMCRGEVVVGAVCWRSRIDVKRYLEVFCFFPMAFQKVF